MRSLVLVGALCMLGCNAAATKTSDGSGGNGSGGAGGSEASAGNGAGNGAVTGAESSTGVTSTAAGMTTTGSGTPSGISVLVEPGAGIQPLVTAISGAHTSVHMTMYLLTSNDVMNALIAQHQAGHDVKVVLNESFPEGGNQNASAFATLSGAGVKVVYAPTSFTYTHEKCVIIDDKQAWIMTMNATISSATDNREYLAIDNYAADVAQAEAIFEADYAKMVITPSEDLVVAPTNAEDKMVALINSATQTVEVEDEELSDSAVVQALGSKQDAGVKVNVVLSNATLTNAGTTAIATLKQHGVKIVVLAAPYVHAKAIVVDSASVYVGSENLTYNSLAMNRELGVITTVAQVVSTINSTIKGDFANGTAQ